MSRERWFRHQDEIAAFDWEMRARELGVPVDVARALWLRAMRLTTDRRRAETLYLRWLRDAAAARQPAAVAPVPGRQTRVMYEASGADRGRRSSDIER